jgi:hypothetical protein
MRKISSLLQELEVRELISLRYCATGSKQSPRGEQNRNDGQKL